MRLVSAQSDAHWAAARALVEEYAASLKLDLSFQDFAHELLHLRSEYGPPHGAFVLLQDDTAYLGCVGLRKLESAVGEIKRLYVRPAGRGRGAGRLLAVAIIDQARALGYHRLLLDTMPFMKEAQALYASLGFRPTAPYRYNPVAGAAFLELRLRE